MEELFAGHFMDISKMLARLKQVAADEGLPFGYRHYTYNSRKAQELGKWAETRGKGDMFHLTAFHAYFAEGKNIAETPVLLDMAESAGLNRNEAAKVLENRTFKDAVDADWALSRKMNIKAIPCFAAGNQILSGAQPYEMLEKMLKSQGVRKRGTAPV